MVTARYDGHADWYDAWWAGDGAPAMAAAGDLLRELLPERVGLALDVGCGTAEGPRRPPRRAPHGAGPCDGAELRHARTRLPVAVADATALPPVRGWGCTTGRSPTC